MLSMGAPEGIFDDNGGGWGRVLVGRLRFGCLYGLYGYGLYGFGRLYGFYRYRLGDENNGFRFGWRRFRY